MKLHLKFTAVVIAIISTGCIWEYADGEDSEVSLIGLTG